MDKKLLACMIIIIILAGIVLFFVLRDFGFLGQRGRFNPNAPSGFNSNDPTVFMPRIKSSLGLPADANDARIKDALGLPQDANFEQIRNAFMQRIRTQQPQEQGGN